MAFEAGSIIARFRSETKALLDGIRNVDRAFANLKRSVSGTFAGFDQPLAQSVNRASRTVGTFFNTIRRQADRFRSGIRTVFSSSFAIDNQTINRVRARAGLFFDRLRTQSVNALNSIRGSIGDAFGINREALNRSLSSARTFFNTLGTQSLRTLEGVRTGLSGAFTISRGAINRSTQSVRSFFSQISNLSTRSLSGLRTALESAFSISRPALNAASRAISASFNSIGAQAKDLGTNLVNLGRISRRSFTFLRRGFNTLISPLTLLNRLLARSIFNFRNLVVVVGAGLFVQRAKEVETLRLAFENLSASIGGVASSFLDKLRTATRGAVSDLELFRTTNNAILLGVVQSEDQFTELASIARQLGRAVGRDAVQALNDLSIGIGRQSRLILDNLGIVVSAEKAYNEYAASIGKTADELTDAQRKQAFLNATIESARRKVASLGPDVFTLADQWDRLSAAVSNTVSVLATELVGGGVAGAVATFLDENRRRIAVTARIISESARDFVNVFSDITRDFNFRDIVRFISDGISVAFTSTLQVVGALLPPFIETLFRTLFTAFRGMFELLRDNLPALAQNTTRQASGLILRAFSGAFDALGNLIPENTRRFIKEAIDVVENEQANVLEVDPTALRDKIVRPIGDGIVDGLSDIKEVVDDVFSGSVIKIPEPRIDSSAFLTGVDRFLEFVNQRLSTANIRFANPLEALDPIQVDSLLRPLQNVINRLQQLQLIASRLPKSLQILNIEGVRRSADAVIFLRDKLGDLSSAVVSARRFLGTLTIPEAEFIQKLQPFEEALKKIRLEADTLDLSPAQAELFKFNQAFENLGRSLTGSQQRRLDELRQSLEKAVEARDAAEAIDDFNTALDALDQKLRQVATTQEGIDLQTFGRSVADLVGKFGGQAELANEFAGAVTRLGEQAIRGLNTELKTLDVELEAVSLGLSGVEINARQVQSEWAELRSRLSANIPTEQLDRVEEALNKVVEAQRKIARTELIVQLRDEFSDELNDVNNQIALLKGTITETDIILDNLDRRMVKEIARLKEMGGTASEIDNLRLSFAKLATATESLELEKQLKITANEIEDRFIRPTTNAIATGIANGLRRGQSALETFAEIGGRLFDNALNDAVKNLSSAISAQLAKAFGPGVGGAVAGIGSSLVGVAGLILSNIEGRTNTVVDDFEDAINSAEAIRGVVAGPTNVALSAVGDQLREALQTSELFLRRIALATESMANNGGATTPVGTGPNSFTFPLTTSTV